MLFIGANDDVVVVEIGVVIEGALGMLPLEVLDEPGLQGGDELPGVFLDVVDPLEDLGVYVVYKGSEGDRVSEDEGRLGHEVHAGGWGGEVIVGRGA